jgi:putative hydrolase of HD superfamily
MDTDRLKKQLAFVLEADKLKQVSRRTILIDRSREENSAEHSWHIALMALTLGQYVNEQDIDLLHVLKLMLVHDLVEIDAGDTYCYDEPGMAARASQEVKAAERVFGILPGDQATELRGLWDEFEARETPEARFAAALDRLQPLLFNYKTDGAVWKKHGIKRQQVISRNQVIGESAPALWEYVLTLIDDAVERGWLEK